MLSRSPDPVSKQEPKQPAEPPAAEITTRIVSRCQSFLRDTRRPKQGSFSPTGPEQMTLLRALRYFGDHGSLSEAQVAACDSTLKHYERCLEINNAVTPALREKVITLLKDVITFCRSCATEMKPTTGYKYRELNPSVRNSGVQQRINELEAGSLLTPSALSSPARALEQIDFLERHRKDFVKPLSASLRGQYASLADRLSRIAQDVGLDAPWDDSFARYHLSDVLAAKVEHPGA